MNFSIIILVGIVNVVLVRVLVEHFTNGAYAIARKAC